MAHSKARLLLLPVLVPIAFSACTLFRKKTETAKQYSETPAPGNTPGGVRLDSSDVAILMPLPLEPEGIGGMWSPFGGGGEKPPLIEPELFRQIVEQAEKYTDSRGKEITSGIQFTGTRPDTRLDVLGAGAFAKGPFDFRDPSLWKVVALRLDPCAPSPENNHLKEGHQFPQAWDSKICTPQVRFTVQPVVPTSLDPSPTRKRDVGDNYGKVKAADYALHLIFKLASEEELRNLAKGLVAFKQECGRVTQGAPLGVHPCFLSHREGRLSLPVSPQDKLQGLFTGAKMKLEAAAFMGTQLGIEPWIFASGVVKDGKFTRIPLRQVSLTPEELAAATTAGGGKRPLISFDNGQYQMSTQVMLRNPTASNLCGLIRPESLEDTRNPVTPLPVPGHVRAEIASFLQQGPLQKAVVGMVCPSFSVFAEESRAHLTKLFEASNKVENPKVTDALSSDCISCHQATALTMRIANAPSTFNQGLSSSEEALWALHKLHVQAEQGSYRHQGAESTAIQPYAMQRSNYSFLNFGYFDETPSISRRTANEAAASAALLNTSVLGLGSEATSCAKPREYQGCLERASLEGLVTFQGTTVRFESWGLHDNMVASELADKECRRTHCGDAGGWQGLWERKTFTTTANVTAILPWNTNGPSSDIASCEPEKGTRIDMLVPKSRNGADEATIHGLILSINGNTSDFCTRLFYRIKRSNVKEG